MPITLSGSTGALFNRLGKLGYLVKLLKNYQTALLSAMTDTTNGVVAQYNAESDIQAIMGSSYISILSATGSIIGSVSQSLASATAGRTVYRANPQLNQTLTEGNTLASLLEIIKQMRTQNASVLAMTVTATASAFTGNGSDGAVVTSVKRGLDGKVLENSFGETLTITCTQDSYIGGATAGNESFSLTGVGAQNDFFAFNWPLGSNCQTSLSAIDGDVDNGAGNLLTNSSFDTFTTNVPDNWELVVGTAGTHIFEEDSIVLSGKAVRFLGDGTTKTEIRQLFGDSGGTSAELDPLTQYAFNAYLRRDGSSGQSGTLTVELVDENNTVIKDGASVDNSFTINLGNLTTNYQAFNGVFRTPLILPSSVYLRIRQSVAYSSGKSFYMDKAALGPMTQAYVSGPFVSVFSGGLNFALADYATVTVANSRGSGGTLSTFQTLTAQLFPSEVLGNELLLPSSATPTISDSALIA